MSPYVTRRGLLRTGALSFGAVAGSALLAACGGAASVAGQVASTSAAAPVTSAAPTTVAAFASTAAATSASVSTAVSVANASTSSAAKTAATSAAVSSSASSTVALANGAVSLEFWSEVAGPIDQGLLNPWAQKFTQQHPDITVNMRYIAGSNNSEKYTSAMVAGTPPDGILTSGFPIAVQWAANGQIQPMDEWAGQLGVKQQDYFSWVWNMQHFHGKLWCLLQEYDTNVFVWNKALFRTAGLNADAPPTQIAALDDAAAKLDKKQADGSIAQAGFIPWLSANISLWIAARGGDIYDATNGKWTFDTPQARDALTWYQQYLKRLGDINAVNTLTKTFTGKVTGLGSGKLGQQIVGDWVPLYNYNVDSPSLEYGVGMIPMAPGVAPGTNTVIGSDTFVLPVGVKHPQESMQFMLYMDSADPVLAWCVGEANVPPTPAMANDPTFLKGVPYGKTLVDMAKPELLHPFPVAPTYSDATGFLNTAVSNVLKGTTTVEAALTQAQQLADQKQQAFSAAKPGW
ncbi:MAG TPA: extracellular solute-binding protein [Chloroflexota bacterium]